MFRVVAVLGLLALALADAASSRVVPSRAEIARRYPGAKFTPGLGGAVVPDWSGASAEDVARVCAELRKSDAVAQCAHPEPTRLAVKAKAAGKVGATLDPIVLVPGLGGSALEAKLDKPSKPAWYCFKKWDWFRLWLNVPELLVQECWFDNLQIEYNETTNDYHNPEGVTTRAADFGGLKGVDYLDYIFGFPVPLTGYFHSMIASLEAVGYKAGENLFGAPFDWRVPTTDHELTEQHFYADFKRLIEAARAKSGGRRVHVVTHSMGGPTALRFFNLQDQAWLDANVASFIPVAGPWSGSPKALRAVLSGDDFGLNALGFSLMDMGRVKQVARQAGGIIYLIPDPAFYTAGEVFVAGPKGETFNAKQFRQLFDAVGTPVSALIHFRTQNIINNLRAPRVPAHCVFGFGLPTETFYNYTSGWDAQPVISEDNDGDGTVPLESLKECSKWASEQAQRVDVKEFNLVGHSAILEDEDVFNYVIAIATHA
jgi:pimeloyl-ACP methyl ester carboxylesterase